MGSILPQCPLYATFSLCYDGADRGFREEEGDAPMAKMSMSREDYLEAMVMLGGDTVTPVRSVDVAEKLGVARASVNRAVADLKEMGLIEQAHYGSIMLTEAGLGRGRAILDRHELLTSFLVDHLGIEPAVAEEEACQMEHAISDASYAKWEAFIAGLDR